MRWCHGYCGTSGGVCEDVGERGAGHGVSGTDGERGSVAGALVIQD
jgi:hypothetical protein